MENLKIDGSDFGPLVVLNVEGRIEISGKSMMEDAETFYQPIHNWIASYLATSPDSIEIEMNLKYFNSSSAKQLLKLLMKIDEIEGLKAGVIWLYPKANDILLERGEELAIMVDLPFDYKAH